MKINVERFVANRRNLVVIFAMIALFASMKSLLSGSRTFVEQGIEY